jgi:hypothetical protein
MRKRALSWLLPVGLLFASTPAQASGGHYGVDDATIAEPGRCQIEAWYARVNSANDDVTAMPACNPTGNLELTLGLSRVQEEGRRDTIVELAAKTLFQEMAPGRVGWGLAVATTWSGALERREGATLYVPASFQASDAWVFHANVGWSFERDERNAALWGVAANYVLAPNLSLIAEAYGTHRGQTEFQGGLRYTSGAGAVDLGYGRMRADAGEDWFTVGFSWTF